MVMLDTLINDLRDKLYYSMDVQLGSHNLNVGPEMLEPQVLETTVEPWNGISPDGVDLWLKRVELRRAVRLCRKIAAMSTEVFEQWDSLGRPHSSLHWVGDGSEVGIDDTLSDSCLDDDFS